MTLGFALMDLLYLAGLGGLTLLAATAGLAAHSAALPAGAAIAMVAALAAAAAAWIAAVAVAGALVPRPRAGRFRLLGHPVFYFWTLAFLLRRYLEIPPIQTLVFHFNLVRFLVMRLLGARVHFTTSMSSDVLLLDPALFRAGPGCVLGAQSIFAGHLVLEGRLLLGPIELGRDVEVGGRSMLGPGVTVGDGARIGIAVSLAPGVTIGAGARIGPHALIDAGARIGKNARVLGNTYVPPGTEIADDETWVGEGQSSPETAAAEQISPR